MTLKTLECRLYAPSDTLRYLWLLMSEKNTPLINEILNRLSEHPDFDEWFKAKQIPKSAITAFCNNLKRQEIYQNQPGRFYSSAHSRSEIPAGSLLLTICLNHGLPFRNNSETTTKTN